MANTPQAKKRIRRNATRETINHSRVSRIRTFIKAVESALASGKKADAAEALKQGSAGDRPRRRTRSHPQEHGGAESFATLQAGSLAKLNPVQNRDVNGPSGDRRPFFFPRVKKMQQLPRFAQMLIGA